MKVPRLFYLIFVVIGTVVPWVFFAGFIAQEGLNIPLFIQSLFVNEAAAGFSADVLISLFVFWVWSYADARQKQLKNWWLVLPAGFLVGLSLAMPLYFYLRSED
jgi:hypothetical protein